MPLPVTWSFVGAYFIPHRIQMLTRMIDRETGRELLKHFNLSVADWRVLGLTNNVGSSSAADICNAFEIDRAEVSRAVARLIGAGLVEREADPAHRGKKRISPTEKGKTLFERAVKMRQDYFAKIMQDLSAEDMEVLEKALLAMALRVDEFRSEGDESHKP